jgi:hypothetical protein
MKDIERADQIGRTTQAAWARVKKAQTRLWSDWMIVGDGLLEGRRWAMQQADTNKPEGKGYVMAFNEWLKRYKLADMHKADRAKLLQLMEERMEVEEWRNSLPVHEQRSLNNPTGVWRRYTAATRVKPARPKPSAKEMTRARVTIGQQQARIVELEDENASLRERIKELEKENGKED